jgi:D-3-phosphoglycerate dehydrogenase
MTKKVLVTADGIGNSGMEYFAERGVLVIDSNNPSPEEELIESAAREQVDAIIVRRATVTAAVMDASKNLKGVVKVGAGLDSIDIPAATERGLVVCNGAGINSQATAELAFSLILAVVRRIVPLAGEMKQAIWSQNQYRVDGLAGQVLGIVGLGHIGRLVAAMARPFGAKLCAFSPHAPDEAFGNDIERMGSLEDLLKIADVISVHAPGRPENRNLFNEKTFALMKPSALFINTGRGSVVDETALATALEKGVIAGAGLDVFEPEPMLPHNPLLTAPNLVMTPHVSSRTHRVITATARQAAATTCRIIEGKRPEDRFLVNPEVYNQ